MGVMIENREKTIKIKSKSFYVDGFCPKTNTVYEFYGDFWHGNPKKYNSFEINPFSKKTYGELYNLTMKREKILKTNGYKIISVWESDFNKLEGLK